MLFHEVKDETGNQYGRLTVLERVENDRHGNAQWKCICECGKLHITRGVSLRNGDTQSCGCLQRERAVEVGRNNRTHGKSGTLIYKRWKERKKFKSNPQRWRDKEIGFASFVADRENRNAEQHS